MSNLISNLRPKVLSIFTFPENFSDNLTIFRYVLLLFLTWRVSLLLIAYFGLSVLPTENFYHQQLFLPHPGIEFWTKWTNWDGQGYINIAQHGYIPGLTVFFPLYPILIKFVSLSGLSFFWSGFLISQIATIIALIFLYKLILLDFKSNTVKRSLLALLVFPASFYLGTLYNESVVLATALAAFYFARKNRWFLAALFASLAVSTRLVGIAAVLGLIVEYLLGGRIGFDLKFLWQTLIGRGTLYAFCLSIILAAASSYFTAKKAFVIGGVLSTMDVFILWLLLVFTICLAAQQLGRLFKILDFKKFLSINLLFLIFSILPLILYLVYQQLSFGSALTFVHSEQSWGRILAVPWSGPLYALKVVFHNPFNLSEFSAHFLLRSLIFILSLAGLCIAFKKLRISYATFYLVAFLIPLFSGTIADVTRFTLIIFPLFIILGTIENELAQKTYVLISSLLLSMLTILFINGYFFI